MSAPDINSSVKIVFVVLFDSKAFKDWFISFELIVRLSLERFRK